MERDEHPQIPPPTAAGLGQELQRLVGMQRGLGYGERWGRSNPTPGFWIFCLSWDKPARPFCTVGSVKWDYHFPVMAFQHRPAVKVI